MQVLFPAIAAAVKVAMRAMGWRMLVSGDDAVPSAGPAVVVCNHVSYLDPVIVGYAIEAHGRIPRFLAKRDLFSHPLLGPVMRRLRQIPVDRGGAAATSLEVAAALLREGEVVVVFPEGTISTSFVPAPPRSGAGRLAVATGAPLIPVALWGGQRLVTKNRPRSLRRGVVLAARFGEPIDYEPGSGPERLTARIWEQVTDLVSRAQRTYPQQPAGPDDRWWLPRHLGGTAPSVEEGLELRRREAEARRARARGQDSGKTPPGRPGA
jgi:1-acyl-sn-glycerol-3-phosphate acyltransferase